LIDRRVGARRCADQQFVSTNTFNTHNTDLRHEQQQDRVTGTRTGVVQHTVRATRGLNRRWRPALSPISIAGHSVSGAEEDKWLERAAQGKGHSPHCSPRLQWQSHRQPTQHCLQRTPRVPHPHSSCRTVKKPPLLACLSDAAASSAVQAGLPRLWEVGTLFRGARKLETWEVRDNSPLLPRGGARLPSVVMMATS
jgi:hypothetical protein